MEPWGSQVSFYIFASETTYGTEKMASSERLQTLRPLIFDIVDVAADSGGDHFLIAVRHEQRLQS
jgi:hypothetical protein